MSPKSPMNPFYRFAFIVVTIWLNICGWKVLGKENIPQDETYVIIANHRENADPTLVGCAFPRQVRFLYKNEFGDHLLMQKVIEGCRAIPINRGEADMAAIRTALQSLKEGYAIGVFPEGTRNRQPELLEFKEGGAFLAYKANVKIVPVGIINTRDFYRFWKRNMRLIIGEPITVKVENNDLRGSMDKYNELTREKITILIQEAEKSLVSKN